jgi:hypothetical protein
MSEEKKVALNALSEEELAGVDGGMQLSDLLDIFKKKDLKSTQSDLAPKAGEDVQRVVQGNAFTTRNGLGGLSVANRQDEKLC